MAATVSVFWSEPDPEERPAIEEAVLAIAPLAIANASQIAIRLMKKLAPKRTGKLERSIRFSLGKLGGDVKVSKPARGRGSRGGGKARVIGYIIAGDETTLVGGGTPNARGKGTGRKGKVAKGQKWQNARLQEFGTRNMPAHPYFYPAWRAMQPQVYAAIQKSIREAIRQATANSQKTPTPAAIAA